MRPIKFRAWSVLDKRMIPWISKDDGCSFGNEFDDNDLYLYLSGEYDTEGLYEFMQFTGLTDKNGKEIYEGDIVKNNSFVANTEWIEIIRDIRCLDRLSKEESNREIIGNIHENPELLEAKE